MGKKKKQKPIIIEPGAVLDLTKKQKTHSKKNRFSGITLRKSKTIIHL